MSHKFSSLSEPAFGNLFEDFRHTAFRLETLQLYDVSYEEDDFDRFLAGRERSDTPGIASWVDQVSRGRAKGKSFQRVHVISEPLSDYVRFECAWSYRDTEAAGEDVRLILAGGGEWPQDVPHVDYWLFDSAILVWMIYDAEGRFQSGEITEDSVEVGQAVKWRDRAVHLSVPFQEFDKQFDEYMHKRSGGHG